MAGHHGNADRGIDRVIHRRSAIGPTHHSQTDQVTTAFAETLVREKSLLREVRDEQTGVLSRRSSQGEGELSSLRTTQVERDRLLALVESFPVETRSVRRQRPAMEIRSAADLIEANDFGAH